METPAIKSETNCPLCGTRCIVGGTTTHYYLPYRPNRLLSSITKSELKEVNEIIKGDYISRPDPDITRAGALKYQCFSKSHAMYSGYAVVKVYEYLKSVGINIFRDDPESDGV